jgi:hypothetical protein
MHYPDEIGPIGNVDRYRGVPPSGEVDYSFNDALATAIANVYENFWAAMDAARTQQERNAVPEFGTNGFRDPYHLYWDHVVTPGPDPYNWDYNSAILMRPNVQHAFVVHSHTPLAADPAKAGHDANPRAVPDFIVVPHPDRSATIYFMPPNAPAGIPKKYGEIVVNNGRPQINTRYQRADQVGNTITLEPAIPDPYAPQPSDCHWWNPFNVCHWYEYLYWAPLAPAVFGGTIIIIISGPGGDPSPDPAPQPDPAPPPDRLPLLSGLPAQSGSRAAGSIKKRATTQSQKIISSKADKQSVTKRKLRPLT